MATDLARRCVKIGPARIAAVCDSDPAARQRAADEFGAAPEESDYSLCGRADVDAVLVGSPPAAHRASVLTAADHGKPIFCEKPLGLNVAECDEMIAACERAGVPLFVGQVLRLFPVFWKSRSLIEEGVIGDPRAVSITRSGYSAGFGRGWRGKREIAGGLLLEVSVHELDYMRFLLGKPAEVYARLDNLFGATDFEDQAFVMVTFESGATAHLHASVSSPIGRYHVEIQGTKG